MRYTATATAAHLFGVIVVLVVTRRVLGAVQEDNKNHIKNKNHNNELICPGKSSGTFHYNVERCYNATHILELSGTCTSGQTDLDYAIFKSCQATLSGSDPLQLIGYCHDCGHSRLVCSNSQVNSDACGGGGNNNNNNNNDLQGICSGRDSQSTYALDWGCATPHVFFKTWQECTADSATAGGTEHHFQTFCEDVYGTDEPFCLQCGPGTQLCASQGATCESLGLDQNDGFPNVQGIVPKNKPAIDMDSTTNKDGTTTDTTPGTNGDDNDNDNNEDDDEGEASDSPTDAIHLPIDPNDSQYKCSSFHGDTNFYKESCFNSTHTVVVSGTCINGKRIYGSRAVAPCRNAGPGFSYCHACQHKLVCASSPNASIVCDSAMVPDNPPRCPSSDNGDDVLPLVYSTYTECVNTSTYRYTYEVCSLEDETDSESPIVPVLNKQDTLCHDDNHQGLNHCATCRDGIHLCSRQEAACGSHDQEQNGASDTATLNNLNDNVTCASIGANINYYVEECFNSTHVKLSQGECVNGVKNNRQTVLQVCTDYGEDASRQFCHQCHGSSVVCSSNHAADSVCHSIMSIPDLTEKANVSASPPPSSSPPPAAAAAACVTRDSHLAGSFGCMDQTSFATWFQTCQEGQFAAERNAFDCLESFPGYPYCYTCGKINICAEQAQESCAAIGLEAL